MTVAIGHCAELRRRGHDVLLSAGWQGSGAPPTQLEGVPARLWPSRSVLPGYRHASLYSVDMHHWIRKHAKDFDVAHLHLARDLVPLIAASALRRAGTPYVVQTHGMIRPDGRLTARLIDLGLTLPALDGATHLLSLTPAEDDDLVRVTRGKRSPLRLRNGIAVNQRHVRRAPDETAGLLDILFMARLHPRKRVMTFARAAAALIIEGVPARFSIVGPDEGDLPLVMELLAEHPAIGRRLTYEGALDHEAAIARLRMADVYVLPSVHEPYPMTVLEALAAGIPVVCTTSCGLSSSLDHEGAAEVVDPAEDEIVRAIRHLILDRDRRRELGKRALETAASTYSLSVVVDELEAMYADSEVISATSG
ncbi:glycosyltransferase [Actinoplanes sp. NBC_00393]|uniref:glycosyltransferase n=1 Tax=Actinoplanes sp. NBC_00393 TaxID=2975953 RepID=UPI002E1CE2E9